MLTLRFFEGLLWPDQHAALTGQSDYVIWVGLPRCRVLWHYGCCSALPVKPDLGCYLYLLEWRVPLGKPVVSERSQQPPISGNVFIVRPGDTLYSIAWRAGKDYKTLAQINGISAPFTIYPGQRLLLVAAERKGRLRLQMHQVEKANRRGASRHRRNPRPRVSGNRNQRLKRKQKQK